MSDLKNIILGWTGVITNVDLEQTINAFEELGAVEFKNHFSKDFQSPIFEDYELGIIPLIEFRRELKRMIPKKIKYNVLNQAWFSMLLDTPIINIEVLKKLGKNYRLFLLCNTNALHVKMYNEIFKMKHNLPKGINPLFEKVYYSYEIGMRKPHKEAFKFVLNDKDLDISETLFIDDSIQNIHVAKRLGLKTYYINNESKLNNIRLENY